MARRLPALEAPTDVDGWSGLYEMTPDHNPVLGFHPDLPRLIFANGFSGHGLMMSPATGRDRVGAGSGWNERDVRRRHLRARPLRTRRPGARRSDDLGLLSGLPSGSRAPFGAGQTGSFGSGSLRRAGLFQSRAAFGSTGSFQEQGRGNIGLLERAKPTRLPPCFTRRKRREPCAASGASRRPAREQSERAL